MRPKAVVERTFQKALGQHLARERRAKGLPQVEIHRRTGLSIEFISRVENGHANPTILTLRDWIRNGLWTRLSEFFKGWA